MYATLRLKIGQPLVDIDVDPGETVRTVITEVLARHPELSRDILDENDELVSHVHVFLGGRNVRLLNGLDTIVERGQRLDIFPPVGGGACQPRGNTTAKPLPKVCKNDAGPM